MHRHSAKQLERYLRILDGELTTATEIVVIGGSAVSLRFRSAHATMDIDLWGNPGKAFWAAVARARRVMPVPVQAAPVAEPQYDFEDRLEKLPLGLKKLTVFVPEAHDLALLKIARGEAHDLDAVEDIHRAQSLSLDTLVARYHETVPQVMGPKSRFQLNFLMAVARVFGDEVARRMEDVLGRQGR
jgi:hypothetical protein